MLLLLCRVLWITVIVQCCRYKYEDISKHKNFHMLPIDECGESESDRIVGGSSASLGQLPFMARIGYAMANCEDEIDFKCGGGLITKDHVITAAHCVSDLPKGFCKCSEDFEQFYVKIVRLGEHNINTDPDCEGDICAEKVQDIEIDKIIVHPYYGKPRLRNDIALIKLKTSADLNGWVAPVCMVYGKYANRNYTGVKGTVAGWGLINTSTKETSDDLQILKVPIVNPKRCYDAFKKMTNVSHWQQICAGGVQGQDSCSGDSGGPLVITDNTDEGPRYKILGIVSFGFKMCAKRPIPAIYTNLLYYAGWVLDNL